MRILICGDRNWTDAQLVHDALCDLVGGHLEAVEVVIDGAARGADTLGHSVATSLGLKTLRFPALWNKYGRGAGPIRNQQMLDEGKPTHVLAFHNDLEHSKGTKDMVRRAREASLPVEVYNALGRCGNA